MVSETDHIVHDIFNKCENIYSQEIISSLSDVMKTENMIQYLRNMDTNGRT